MSDVKYKIRKMLKKHWILRCREEDYHSKNTIPIPQIKIILALMVSRYFS
jgi:hypothetical protein